MGQTNFKEKLQEILKTHSIKEVKKDLEKMFLSYMCSDEAEDSTDRQSATVTYQILKKVLDQIE